MPARATSLCQSGLIGPHGEVLADVGDEPGLVVGTLDREDPALQGALDFGRPWRASARRGDIYVARRVTDERSRVRARFWVGPRQVTHVAGRLSCDTKPSPPATWHVTGDGSCHLSPMKRGRA